MLDVEKLKHLRLVFNINQDELAERIGISRNYISMMENRKQPIPQDLYDKWIKALYKEYDFRETEEGKKKLQEKEEQAKLKALKKEQQKKVKKDKVNKK